jgi:hypothetical protein
VTFAAADGAKLVDDGAASDASAAAAGVTWRQMKTRTMTGRQAAASRGKRDTYMGSFGVSRAVEKDAPGPGFLTRGVNPFARLPKP